MRMRSRHAWVSAVEVTAPERILPAASVSVSPAIWSALLPSAARAVMSEDPNVSTASTAEVPAIALENCRRDSKGILFSLFFSRLLKIRLCCPGTTLVVLWTFYIQRTSRHVNLWKHDAF